MATSETEVEGVGAALPRKPFTVPLSVGKRIVIHDAAMLVVLHKGRLTLVGDCNVSTAVLVSREPKGGENP